MSIFIVPENFVYSFIYEFDVVVCFGVGVEKVDLSILVLEDKFCGGFVNEHSENGIVRLVFHDDVFVFQMVEFQF